MQGTLPQAHGLPLWAQILSLAIASFLAILRAVEFFEIPELDVRLTRDLYFRLIDDGEVVFCHAVLLARKGPVLIQDIELTLKRVGNRDRAEKSFPIRVIRFGEKVKGPGLTAENHFYSSSPLLYFSENEPQRAVYLGVQREYQSTQQRAVQSFVGRVRGLKEKFSKSPTQPLGAEAGEQALKELQELITESHREMIGLIQLEVGEYELNARVTYEAPGFKLWTRRAISTSSIGFSVEEQSLSNWKAQLSDTLRVQATNLLTDGNNFVRYPEFQPVEFKEPGSQQ
jgi:hypothetical protein